jgi:hypothetical protein
VKQSSMTVQITSSHQKGNAPAGYLLARVEIAHGFYAEAERNPYTNGEWRWISFHLGDWDAPGNESVVVCSVPVATIGLIDVASKVLAILHQVSLLFESSVIAARFAGASKTTYGSGAGD